VIAPTDSSKNRKGTKTVFPSVTVSVEISNPSTFTVLGVVVAAAFKDTAGISEKINTMASVNAKILFNFIKNTLPFCMGYTHFYI
jgi:hypothetical protein